MFIAKAQALSLKHFWPYEYSNGQTQHAYEHFYRTSSLSLYNLKSMVFDGKSDSKLPVDGIVLLTKSLEIKSPDPYSIS